uniref:hypothetical protein n=1 Tax=uncultured Halomonas sp. TaxID=173971 RepID=UPI002626AB15|nr:hypothetical protein [uncultured Halomonas sp.]
MSNDRPDYFERGQKARLIPTIADTNKEERALSILLSALVSVHEFRHAMLHSLGVRVGSRAQLEAWTEVVFKKSKKDQETKGSRPDGALILDTGKKQWKALIEAKVGTDEVGETQLSSYIEKAKDNNFDAVITITNQFAALPDHHPVKLPKKTTKSIDIYHWSWTYAITQAELLLQSDGIDDEDQRYILSEVVEYFNDKNSGKIGFTTMNKEWKDLVGKCRNNSTINKSSSEVINTVSSWHQEQRELCLKMWTLIGEKAEVKLPRAHKKDPNKRLVDDCQALASEKRLTTTIQIPNAASDLTVTASLVPRTITCSMKLEAPKDKVKSSAKLNWLLRQIPDSLSDNFHIKAFRPGRAPETDKPINELKQDPDLIEADNSSTPPSSFEVFYTLDLAGKFQGNRVFIEQLEEAVPFFYEKVGQHLRAWVAPPPKVKKASNPLGEIENMDTEPVEDD